MKKIDSATNYRVKGSDGRYSEDFIMDNIVKNLYRSSFVRSFSTSDNKVKLKLDNGEQLTLTIDRR